MQVKKISIKPSLQRPNGHWLLYPEEVALPEGFRAMKNFNHFVSIPPTKFAGNHKHERQEILLALHPDLILIWQDEKGEKHTEEMNPNGDLLLFFIPSFVPHVVINKSQTSPAVLYEWTDSKSKDKEVVNLLDS